MSVASGQVIETIPVLPTSDIAGLMPYLETKLGFTDPWTYGSPIFYGSARFEGHRFHVHQTSPPGKDFSAVYIWVKGVDAYYDRFKANGADVTEIGDRPYGMRDFDVHCPGGTRLSFGAESH